MGLFNELNKPKNRKWSINTDGYEYKKCSELRVGAEYPLRGCFITPDNGYGKGAVLITDGFLVNCPNREDVLETIDTILKDDKYFQAIEDDKVSFIVTTFKSKKFNRTGYSIEFKDR